MQTPRSAPTPNSRGSPDTNSMALSKHFIGDRNSEAGHAWTARRKDALWGVVGEGLFLLRLCGVPKSIGTLVRVAKAFRVPLKALFSEDEA